MSKWLIIVVLFGAITLGTKDVSAQYYAPRAYDGIQAGLDAYQLAEERRRANIDQQLYLNDQMKAWSGLPTSRGETIYYGYGAPFSAYGSWYGSGYSVSREFAYAYGPRTYYHRGWNRYPTVFEPWPYIPGDIYGYQGSYPVRQPVGQHQEQTGPNRWESHPVYDPPLPQFRVLPPVELPLHELPADAEPPPPIPPPLDEKALPQEI